MEKNDELEYYEYYNSGSYNDEKKKGVIMSKLKAVDPKKTQPSKPKVLIFGKAGVGKTWVALDFPNVYYIDSEGGANLSHYTDKLKKSGGVYFGPEQGSLDFENVIEQVKALATEKHPYKTLVIDSITEIFNAEVTAEAERLGDKNGFGADKKPAIAYMRKLVSWLKRIDMNAVLIAHEKAEWRNGEQIGDTFDVWDKLEYQLHLCLNIIKAGGKRIAKVRKTRLEGFPDASTFSWSYEEFAKRYGEDVIEKDGEALTLATQEQLKELARLLEIVNIPEDQKAKWLKAGEVDSFEDMDTEKMEKIINHIKTKIEKG